LKEEECRIRNEKMLSWLSGLPAVGRLSWLELGWLEKSVLKKKEFFGLHRDTPSRHRETRRDTEEERIFNEE